MHEQDIFYANRKRRPPSVQLFEFAMNKVRRIAVLEARSDSPVSPDGVSILYEVRERETDLMLVENFR